MSVGGSSGGEAGLLAFMGSPLGVGTDIGGSLRIPAAACGIFSLKPTLGRFPTGRCTPSLQGQESLNAVNGKVVHCSCYCCCCWFSTETLITSFSLTHTQAPWRGRSLHCDYLPNRWSIPSLGYGTPKHSQSHGDKWNSRQSSR